MTFFELHQRLIAAVQMRIRNGNLSERAFARKVGISQPHIHHVLKGVRSPSPQLSDRILEGLGLSVLDLVDGSTGTGAITATPPKRPLRDRSPAPAPRSSAS